MKVFLILFSISFGANCETQVFEAIARYEGKFAYAERHFVTYEDEKLVKSTTEYVDREGKTIGTLKSDFTHSLSSPTYILHDGRHRSIQGLRVIEGKTEVFSRNKERRLVMKKILPLKAEIMIGGEGLIYFIAAHMEKITQEKNLDFQFIIPGRLKSYQFFVKSVAFNEKKAEFEVQMKSWWMRLFGPKLKLIYDVKKKRLLSYEGLSNLRNSEGSMISVNIDYVYKN